MGAATTSRKPVSNPEVVGPESQHRLHGYTAPNLVGVKLRLKATPWSVLTPWSKPDFRYFQNLAERVVSFGIPGCENMGHQ